MKTKYPIQQTLLETKILTTDNNEQFASDTVYKKDFSPLCRQVNISIKLSWTICPLVINVEHTWTFCESIIEKNKITDSSRWCSHISNSCCWFYHWLFSNFPTSASIKFKWHSLVKRWSLLDCKCRSIRFVQFLFLCLSLVINVIFLNINRNGTRLLHWRFSYAKVW